MVGSLADRFNSGGGLATGSVHRSLGTLVVGLHKAVAKKATEGDAYAVGETEQQFQIDVAGKLGDFAFNEVTIALGSIIYIANGQRESENEEPHISFGLVLDDGQPFMWSALVNDWDTDEQGNFIGVTVTFCAFDPTQSGASFSGRLHVTVQGFAAPDDPADDEGDTNNSGAADTDNSTQTESP